MKSRGKTVKDDNPELTMLVLKQHYNCTDVLFFLFIYIYWNL